MVHVEPWVSQRLYTLGATTGQPITRVDFTDDRLEIVLRRLRDDTRWAAFESALNQQTVRVYDLQALRVHVDSTSASAYVTVTDGGLFQFGHSKDYRPDLPQVKVMQAVLDPWGCRSPRMWCRVSGPMTRCLCPALSGSKRASTGTGCYMWGTVRWRRVTRAPGSPPRVIIPCARCPRCNWPRASSTRPWKRSGAESTPSPRSFGRGQRGSRSGLQRVMPIPWR